MDWLGYLDWFIIISTAMFYDMDIAGGLYNIGNSSETHLKFKSHEISFIHNICFSHQISLTFCTEHASDTHGYPILHSTPGYSATYKQIIYDLEVEVPITMG